LVYNSLGELGTGFQNLLRVLADHAAKNQTFANLRDKSCLDSQPADPAWGNLPKITQFPLLASGEQDSGSHLRGYDRQDPWSKICTEELASFPAYDGEAFGALKALVSFPCSQCSIQIAQ
jgi:hypothetical protein